MISDTPPTPFGQLLKTYRLAAGMTQETLAERAGVSARSIRELEHGSTAPRRDTARRLVHALDLSAEQHRAFAAAATPRPRRRLAPNSSPAVAPAAVRLDGVPLPSPGSSPNNLPLQLTSFVGRAQEITDLAHLLRNTRLLTLTGAPGVGKTRLALQVAQRVLNGYPQGVWLVDLGPLTDATLVPHKVATALGLGESAARSALTAVAAQLRPKHLLLLLDNCEHLLDACATLAETLLGSAPHLYILITSRESLGIAGETTWIVPPLTVPEVAAPAGPDDLMRYEAVQLFVERARAAQPGFHLSAGNAAAVAQICCRLDGLPLALELAAARVRTLGVAGVAARLDQQFVLLTGGSRTALPRHRTMRAALDWSYTMLTDAERLLFDRLSVFAGRFTLEAVEAVCTSEGLAAADMLPLLLGVVDKSLVQVDHGDEAGNTIAGYRLLAIVREYGRERLVARGEARMMEARHAAYYLALVERDLPDLPGCGSVARLDRLEGELDNIRAALAWCLDDAPPSAPGAVAGAQARPTSRPEMGLRLAGALMDLWYWRGHRREGLQWLDRALERDPGPPTVARARALVAAGSLGWVLGDGATGQERLRSSIALYRTLGQTADLAFALCLFGFWLRGGSRSWLRGLWNNEPTPDAYRAGTALMDEGLALVGQVGDSIDIAWARLLWARSADLRDEQARADAWSKAQDSLLVFQEPGDPQGLGLAERALGNVALYKQDYTRARMAFAAAVTALRAFGDVAYVALDLAHLGYVARVQGDRATATHHYEDSLALYRQIDFDRDVMSWVLRQLGDLALEHGDVEAARARYAEGLVRAQESGKPAQIAEALDAVARLDIMDGQAQWAAELNQTAAALRAETGRSLPLAVRATLRRAVAQARRVLITEARQAKQAR